MAGIYNADIYCDDCVEDIKNRIATELWAGSKFEGGNGEFPPDGSVEIKEFETREEFVEYLDSMDEWDYDSDSYPKYCSDDEESDCPQHCGSHEDCLNPTELSDGSKVGHFFENSLTTDGEAYVKEAVREGGLVAELWKSVYSAWIDFPGECDNCGCDCDDGYLCEACEELQCAGCGEFAGDLDDNSECIACTDGASEEVCEE